MKKILFIYLFLVAFVSCKNVESKSSEEKIKFPPELVKIFDKHGGLDNWKSLRTLSFNKSDEVHTTDLWSRKTVIHSPKYSLGFDGKDVWISDTTAYKGNASFYYNLYFYFYAMPFVLADDGIIYEKANSITFNGIEYPGIKISYQANIGSSPDDNYILYYNPETYQMEWLAYTVTFRSKKPSDRYNLLKYDNWEKAGDLLLPKKLLWYKKDDNGNPLEPQGTPTEFTLPLLSHKALDDSFFEKPKE